jgi:hypothetical protein
MPNQLIPPQENRPSKKAVLLAAGLGAAVGAVLAGVMCVITSDLAWLYVVPVSALIGAWVRSQRPNILWGQRAS